MSIDTIENISEGNKLIAVFVGWGDPDKESYMEVPNIERNDFPYNYYKPKMMLYHLDWNWLMPVVEKINKICTEKGRELSNHSRDKDGLDNPLDNPLHWKSWSAHYIKLSTKIDYVWDQVIVFLNWYNSIKTNQ